jgi:hypothetical protein
MEHDRIRIKTTRRLHSSLGVTLGLTALAFASTQGCNRALPAVPTSSAPANAVATFKAPSCRSFASGNESDGPPATYFLAPAANGMSLTELSDSGTGLEIRNYWRDANGHNFVHYERGGLAWHYVVPEGQGQTGRRVVFAPGTYQVTSMQGTDRVSGTPTVNCELLSADAAASYEAKKKKEEEEKNEPEPVCTAGQTQACTGPEGCSGEQDCATDGKSWGPCACALSEDAGAPAAADAGLEPAKEGGKKEGGKKEGGKKGEGEKKDGAKKGSEAEKKAAEEPK